MELDIPSIQKAYRRYARVYNFYFGWIFHPGRQTAVELVECKAGNRILEVGVGTGLSLPLYPQGVRVVGIDISPEMLERAKNLVEEEDLTNIESLQVMNAEEMKYPDNSFDGVVAMYVATVVPNPQRFVNEMKRVCKPGGKIIILNHFHNPKTVAGKFVGALAPLSKKLGFRPDLTLEEFLSENKLNVTNRISVNLFDFWTILVVSNDK